MSSANVELVRSIYADWERGDFSSAEWAHPEIEFVITEGPAPGRWRGLAGMAEGWRELASIWEGFRLEADGFREIDTSACSRLLTGADLLHVRDGKVTRFVHYWNRERALADLGLDSEAGSAR